jgi:hypothetical protein
VGILDWIDVGKVSAEKDDLLTNYFYDAGISKQIVDSPNIYLMLGRKGAGKTAVFLHLASKPSVFNEDDIVLAMSLNNYSWNAHGLLKREEKADSISFRDSWRFIILIEAIRGLIEDYNNRKLKIPSQLNDATKVLEKLFSKPVPSWLDLLGEKLFKLSKFKLPSAGISPDMTDLSIDAGEISFEDINSNDSLRSALSNNIENVTNYIEAKLKAGLGNRRIFLLFDRLDEAWDPASIETCKNINTGLILASDYINHSFEGKLRPIAFLREDIFENLSLNDKNKHRQDSGSLLKWDKDSLQKMLLFRINYFARKAVQPEVQDLNELFDRKEMRNRTTPISYINRCTFMRPRDVICFYKYVIENMRDDFIALNAEAPDSEEFKKINTAKVLFSDIIYNAEVSYSDYLKEEIRDEWATQLPDVNTYLDALTNIGKTVITKEELLTQLEQTMGELQAAKIRSILQFLFETSIIGFKVGAIWRYKCNYPAQGFTESPNYKVHFGLTKTLSLTEAYS